MYQLHFKEEPALNHCFILNPTLEGKALFVSFQPYIGRLFVNENNRFHPHIEEEKELRVDALLPPWYIFFPSLCNASVDTTANMSHLPLSTPLAHRIIHSWHSVPLSLLLLPTCERIRQEFLRQQRAATPPAPYLAISSTFRFPALPHCRWQASPLDTEAGVKVSLLASGHSGIWVYRTSENVSVGSRQAWYWRPFWK